MRDEDKNLSVFDTAQRLALAVGVIGLIASVIGLVLSGPQQFFQSYLFAYVFCIALGLGPMVWVLVSYLVGGHWGVPSRRVFESAVQTVWLLAIMFIPVILGMRYVFPWARPEVVSASPVLQHKAPFLNVPFFIIRAVVYFAIWFFLAWRLRAFSMNRSHNLETELATKYGGTSAGGLILFALTMSLASIDWIMSLQPEWYSTAFPLVIMVAQSLTGMALFFVLLPLLRKDKEYDALVSSSFHQSSYFRDLGALLFVAAMLWTYVAYFEFLIYWTGDVPKDVIFYVIRQNGGWLAIFIAVIVFQFVLPFFVLMTSPAKRNGRLLTILSVLVMIGSLLYFYWLVMPTFHPEGLAFHWVDLAALLGLVGLWLAAFLYHYKHSPALVITEAEPAHPVRSGPGPMTA